MKNRFFICFLIIISIILSGCVSAPQVFNESGVSKDDLAVIYTSQIKYAEKTIWAPLVSKIKSIYNENGDRVIKSTDPLKEVFEEARLQPGSYYLVTKCTRGDMYAYPRTAFKVESGKKYVLVCAGDKEEIGFFTKESKFAALLIPLEEFEKIELGVLVKGKS